MFFRQFIRAVAVDYMQIIIYSQFLSCFGCPPTEGGWSIPKYASFIKYFKLECQIGEWCLIIPSHPSAREPHVLNILWVFTQLQVFSRARAHQYLFILFQILKIFFCQITFLFWLVFSWKDDTSLYKPVQLGRQSFSTFTCF